MSQPIDQPIERTNDRKVAFLGGGRMGEAFVSGLIRSGGPPLGPQVAHRSEPVLN